jgi:hypothetical protein
VTPSGVSSKVTSGDKEAEEEFVKACGPTGLSKSLAEQRLEEFGPNELSEKIRNPILIFLSYFWVRGAALLPPPLSHLLC